MSINSLDAHGLIRLNKHRSAPRSYTDHALGFIFDREYLHAFKVLLYSLAATGSLIKSPVKILTQDPVVLQDEIVRIVADELLLISDEQISEFSTISAERIEQKHRLDWIPKYTFLKWMFFEKCDHDRLILIDVDTVCLRSLDTILDSERSFDMSACPVFHEHLYKQSGEILRPSHIFNNLRRMARGDYDEQQPMRVNTGFLDIRGKCLSKDFKHALLLLASKKAFPNEQSYITHFLSQRDDYTLNYLPSSFNFNANFLEHLPARYQIRLLSGVRLLHFPGTSKPWKKPVNSKSKLSHLIWRKIEQEAHTYSSLLSMAS